MSDEKIQLPDFLIAELYKGSLVDLDTFPLKEAQPRVVEEASNVVETIRSTEKIKFLGENGKGVIIIIDQREAVFLMENDLTFLTNILKACQLNLADIAIINIATLQANYQAIKEQLHPRNILL